MTVVKTLRGCTINYVLYFFCFHISDELGRNWNGNNLTAVQIVIICATSSSQLPQPLFLPWQGTTLTSWSYID